MTVASAAAQTAAPKASPAHDPDPKWLAIARTQLGLHEGVGPADNPKVLAYFAEAMHPEIVPRPAQRMHTSLPVSAWRSS